jgi:hypothetical protein
METTEKVVMQLHEKIAKKIELYLLS